MYSLSSHLNSLAPNLYLNSHIFKKKNILIKSYIIYLLVLCVCVVCVEVCALRQACGEHRTTTDTVTRMTRRSLLPVTKSIRPNNLSGCKESIGKNTKKEKSQYLGGGSKRIRNSRSSGRTGVQREMGGRIQE